MKKENYLKKLIILFLILILITMIILAIDYPPKSFGFYEYSAPQYCKITDRAAWALANPSLGYTITEEAIEEAIATSPIENTRTETLCQWIDSLSSPWPHGVLEETSRQQATYPIRIHYSR